MFPYFDAFLCASGTGMIEAMLEPHLKKQANASQTDVGFTFLIIGGVYMFSCPGCGIVSIVFLSISNSYNLNMTHMMILWQYSYLFSYQEMFISIIKIFL